MLILAIINKIMEEQLAVRAFLVYLKRVAARSNQLQLHKRRLADAVSQIEDYVECFRQIDLDKRARLTPKVLQNYLISRKHFHAPLAISRLYAKYAHGKDHLLYEDLLEALLPTADYLLVSHTLTNPAEYRRPAKFTHSCHRERIETIHHLTAFVLSEELKALDQDYEMMRAVTKGSQRVGATLWRLLDRGHDNCLNHPKAKAAALELGLELQEHEWNAFLHWHLHSYKSQIDRQDFMRILDIHEERKRATSACRIDQFKLQEELFKRAEEERLRNERIKRAVADKLALVPTISRAQYLEVMREEHFPYSVLGCKRELRGRKGYCAPANLVKYVVERD